MLVHPGAMVAQLGTILGRLRATLFRFRRPLGAMVARLEAICWPNMRARNPGRQTKKQTKTNMPQTSRNPMLRRVRPQVPPRLGALFGARLAQLWGPCWPMLGAVSPLPAMLGRSGPYVAPSWFYVGPFYIYVVQSRADVGPQKDETQKPWKTHGFARFWQPCWGYVGPALGLCWSIFGLCWPILGLCWLVLGLCWPILGARLSHLGAMLARLEAMLAQHARMGAMLAHVGGCVASAGPCWADLGPMLPHLDSMLAHFKHTLSNLGPMLAHKKTKRKNHGKTHGFARFWQPCWGYVSPALGPCWSIFGLCWPILGLCWLVLGLCWPILGARLSHLGAMLARLEAMLAQRARRNGRRRTKNQTNTKIAQKKPKPHATDGSPQVGPRFAPGSPEVPPRLYCFRGRGSAAGAASLYNLRLPPKASGKGTGEPPWAGARI